MRVMLLGHAGVAVAELRGDDAHGDAAHGDPTSGFVQRIMHAGALRKVKNLN